jgi:8-oxo-dGTP pyrophosphatase MutT (NUDIX family)
MARYYRTGGGVVLDANDRVLVLERDVVRNGKSVHEVRLPKGHVEQGETDEQAALRETCEESGYCDAVVVSDLGVARSEYTHNGNAYTRDEHYFLMRLRSDRHARPDVNPDSEEALFRSVWLENLSEAERTLTYESEKEFARRANRALEAMK